MKLKIRNHYIPRFLLKKFSAVSVPEDDKFFPFALRKGISTKKIETKSVGLAKFFYGKTDDKLENSIGQLERKHAGILRSIEVTHSKLHEFSDDISSFAWLLSVRSRNFRMNSMLTLQKSISAAGTASSTQNARDGMYLYLEKAIADNIRQQFPNLKDGGADQQILQNYVIGHVRQRLNRGDISLLMNQIFRAASSEITEDVFAKFHNDQLLRFVGSGAKHPEKIRLNWMVKKSHEETFVLGDASCFARDIKGVFGHLIGMGDSLSEVYLPVNPNLTLVGITDKCSKIASQEEIVLGAIQTSESFVFSSYRNKKLESIVESEIGKRSYLLSENEIDDQAEYVWTDIGID